MFAICNTPSGGDATHPRADPRAPLKERRERLDALAIRLEKVKRLCSTVVTTSSLPVSPERAEMAIDCIICGKPIEPIPHGLGGFRKICSGECRKERERQLHRERRRGERKKQSPWLARCRWLERPVITPTDRELSRWNRG
jgi:hypothetical protein